MLDITAPSHEKDRMHSCWGKRVLDLVLTVPILALFLPVFVLTGLFVRVSLGAPILFHQLRPGLHGQPFTILKFRTMTDARDAQGNLLPDAERLTPFGRFLRSTSLDELPGLWNVLRGEIRLVLSADERLVSHRPVASDCIFGLDRVCWA